MATLFYVMLGGGALIWLGVVGALFYATRTARAPHSEQVAGRVILWCGVIIPVTVLGALLTYAVWLMPNLRPWATGDEDGLRRIEVVGEQFWWRVRYLGADDSLLFETANEIIVPVGERVLFVLKSPDVIHSFWIPSLGGKMDMIPGRTNHVALQATKPGTYRGVCAEFCGPSHALMAFFVKAIEPQAFEAWVAARQSGAVGADRAGGLEAFLRHGCDACHALDGTAANGTIGPNLTALATRESVGAGALPNTVEDIARFIRYPSEIKPGSRMPSYGMLPERDVEQIAAYLKGLR